LISAVIKKSANTQATPSPFEILKWQNATANRASLFTDAMSNLLVKQYAEPELNN
jgi:general secretion pathway protein K